MNTFFYSTRKFLLLFIISTLVIACSRGQEFKINEQSSVTNNNEYPNFSIKPQAATKQFSNQESQYLKNNLNNQALAIKNTTNAYQQESIKESVNNKKTLNTNIEETLRQIENSSTLDTNPMLENKTTSANIEQNTENLQNEIDNTIRQIEKSGMPN